MSLERVLEKDSEIRNSEIARVFVGQFYVDVALKILGGELLKEDWDDFHPDMINWDKECFYEVKASSKYNYFHLRDEQIERFEKLINNGFPFENPEIFFAFFTHNLTKINGNFNKKSQLFSALADNTDSLLILPYQIVKGIHKEGTSRYDGPYYDPLTRFRRKEFNIFINHPEEILKKFNKNNYNIKRSVSPDFSVNGNKIKPFKIISVE